MSTYDRILGLHRENGKPSGHGGNDAIGNDRSPASRVPTAEELESWKLENGGVREGESSQPELNVVNLADVQPMPVEWLWYPRIPLGMLTLFAGPPGVGKTFVSIDISARVTSGHHWPDGNGKAPIGGVLFVTSEDSLSHTIRPRFDAAEADVSLINCVRGVTTIANGKRSDRSLRFDIDIQRIEDHLASHPETRLVVIDPIPEFLGKCDAHRNEEVRAVLGPVCQMLERTGVAMIGQTHFAKAGGGRALYRALGSVSFVAIARSVWGFIPDGEDDSRTLFLPLKCNLAQRAPGLAYSIRGGIVEWEQDDVNITADAAMQRLANGDGDKLQDAVDWVKERLADGHPVESDQLVSDGKDAGHAFRTLVRARKKAGCKAVKDATGKWFVSLPRQECPNNHPGTLGTVGPPEAAKNANNANNALFF